MTPFEMFAVAGTAELLTWPVDDTFRVIPEAGICAVGRGRGPTYGGHHQPVNLEAGVQATVDEIVAAPIRNEAVVRSAIAAVDERLPKFINADRPLRHTSWTITVVALSQNNAIIGHVGLCRAYLWHHSELIQLTTDHSLEADLIRQGRSEPTPHFRYTESRLLGVGAAPNVDTLTIALDSGDALLLVTPGVWASFTHDDMMAQVQEHVGQPDALLKILLAGSSRNPSLGATAVITTSLGCGGGLTRAST